MGHPLVTVTASGCHEWTGSRFPHGGYGRVKVGGNSHRVSRFVWECVNGPIADGLLVCHTCDNPLCVRLSHLFLGTNAENMADMVAKGRASRNQSKLYPRGEHHHGAKVSDAQVVEIRRRYDSGGTSQAALAREFDVSQSLISQIVRGLRRVDT